MQNRTSNGVSLALTAAIMVVFAIIGLAALLAMQILGGGQQVQRSTDSANLGIARNALVGVNYPLSGSGTNTETQFNGVTDTGNNINLRNYNRVAAQSLLVSLNAAQMAAAGQDNGAVGHAKALSVLAQNVGAELTRQLTNSNAPANFFSSLANLNPVGLLNNKDSINPNGQLQISYMDRGNASNVNIIPNQMPDYNATANTSAIWNQQAPSWLTSVNGFFYLNGYQDGITSGTNVPNTYFVPMRPGTNPRLVSQSQFQQLSSPAKGTTPFGWTAPVPNGLSMPSITQDSTLGSSLNASAYALVEPIAANGFTAAIPHGFIRLTNGASTHATGWAAGKQDVYSYVMNDPQYYPVSKGTALPYFVGPSEVGGTQDSAKAYLQAIITANQSGGTPDCSLLSVGFALTGDKIGMGGVSQSNCATITGIGNSGNDFDNITLSTPAPTGQVNQDMNAYSNSAPQAGLWAVPIVEAAYNISPPQPIGSNSSDVSAADALCLSMLSQRAEGDTKATFTTQQSGIGDLPASRGSLSSPNFEIANPNGANLANDLAANGTVRNYLIQRMYQIDPNFNGNLNSVLSQESIPIAGVSYIYYSTNANGGQGGLVLRSAAEAVADAPWITTFITETPDGKSPANPTEVDAVPISNDRIIDVNGDWGFPHPYDVESQLCLSNWFALTPSSGWNNLLGQIDMGTISTNCGPAPTCANPATFTINYGPNGDTVSIPASCQCENTNGCPYSGPC